MVSPAVITRPRKAATALARLLLPSRFLALLVRVDPELLRRWLARLVKTGAVYGAMVLVLGGLYDRPWEIFGVAARLNYVITRTITDYVARGFRPLFPEWTLTFELVRAVARCCMSHYGDKMVLAPNARFIRRQSEIAGTILGFFACRARGTRAEPLRFNGLEHMWIRAAESTRTRARASALVRPGQCGRGRPPRRFALLFFHGGGFAVLSPRMYIPFGSELQSRLERQLRGALGGANGDDDLRVDVLLANYRKIPEHPHPIPPQDAVKMYHYLLEHEGYAPHEIIVAGDSAGGNLAMATLLRIRDSEPERLPLAGVLSCPFVDLEVNGDDRLLPYCIIGTNAKLAVRAIYHPREGEPSTWGDASPAHCDLRGLPPVYIQTAELDYIHSHATKLYDKARKDGLKDWVLDIYPNVPHVFTFFPSAILPSAEKGLDAMTAFAVNKFVEAARKAESA